MTKILNIAVPTPLRRLFDYRALPNAPAPIGSRVKISFGRQQLIGVVISHSDSSDCPANKLKTIDEVLDKKTLIPNDVLELCQWASQYYHHPIGEVISTALPTLLRQGEAAELRSEMIWTLTQAGHKLELNELKRAPKQMALINLLKQAEIGLSKQQLSEDDISDSAIKAAQEKGLIKSIVKAAEKSFTPPLPRKFSLSLSQLDAVQAITHSLNEFNTFLLDGVTGSGKTEVYLQSIQAALEKQQQALVLVPEISLTPQTIARFKNRFGVQIAVLHSKLNDRERLNAWLLAKLGQAKIIIGTRSAIFTPSKNLGIIIIDEAHDLSYKQQDGFRYSARDLAIRRAQINKVPVVLGSATPSLESLLNAKLNRYQALHLPERAGTAKQPRYHIIDIRGQYLENGVSHALMHAIQAHLKDGNQVLLFLNRRGFAPTLLCHQCGWTADCKRCNTHMVYHQNLKRMHCHHCDSTRPHYTHCPKCGSEHIYTVGVGTERLEESLQKSFPDTHVRRIDRDTTRRKDALKDMLDEINSGEPQILIGTQMLAKGHHFPNVTLVGIIDADSGFFSADFRALERIGQLLVQVAGRSGRAEKAGEVLIQTHQPQNPFLQTLIKQGYGHFAKALLEERRACALPPYQYLALFRAETTQEKIPEKFLEEVKKLAESFNAEQQVHLFGPVPAPMPKRAGRYRAQLLLQSAERQSLQKVLEKLVLATENLKTSRQVRWSLDVDPLEMF